MSEIAELIPKRTIGGIDIQPVLSVPPSLNILIYGKPGAGKTVLAGSASAVAEMSPVLLLDVEGGSLSLQTRYPKVDIVRISSYTQMSTVHDQLRRDKGAGYKTVILDSLTEIQKSSMQSIMQGVTSSNADRDPDIPGMRDWGKNIEQTRRLVRLFRDLPIHTIFTAHEMSDKDPKTGLSPTKPSLSGKLSNEIAGFVDIVAYLYVKTLEGNFTRLLLTAGTDTQVAKDRSDRLPPVIQEPTMEMIYNTIFNPNKQGE